MSDIGKLPFLSTIPKVSCAKRIMPAQETALPQDTLSSAKAPSSDAQLRLHAAKTFAGARTGQAASEANLALGQGWSDFLNGPCKAALPAAQQRASAVYDSQRDGLIGA